MDAGHTAANICLPAIIDDADIFIICFVLTLGYTALMLTTVMAGNSSLTFYAGDVMPSTYYQYHHTCT